MPRYWCHICNRFVDIDEARMVCQSCSSEFIEQVEDEPISIPRNSQFDQQQQFNQQQFNQQQFNQFNQIQSLFNGAFSGLIQQGAPNQNQPQNQPNRRSVFQMRIIPNGIQIQSQDGLNGLNMYVALISLN